MNIAVLGAGNTGQITAFDMAAKGASVRLFTRDEEKADLLARNGLRATGALNGRRNPDLVTADIRKAVQGAELICVQTTAGGHKPMAEAIKPFLEEGQVIIVFNANWGALEFRNALRAEPEAPPVLIGETGTQLYIGSASPDGEVFVKQIKKNASLAMIDNSRCDGILVRLKAFFPQFTKAANILETSLSSANAIVHTPVCLFNLSRIEMGQDFLFYAEGASRSTIEYVDRIDQERVAVMEALGVPARGMLDVLNSFWPDKRDTLYDAIHENPSYKVVKGPKTPDHRFFSEDLPYGIVPLVLLGRSLGVPTPYMSGMVESFERFLSRELLNNGFCPDLAELREIMN